MSANEIIGIIEKSAANPIIPFVSVRQEQNLPDNPATPPPATENIYFQQKKKKKEIGETRAFQCHVTVHLTPFVGNRNRLTSTGRPSVLIFEFLVFHHPLQSIFSSGGESFKLKCFNLWAGNNWLKTWPPGNSSWPLSGRRRQVSHLSLVNKNVGHHSGNCWNKVLCSQENNCFAAALPWPGAAFFFCFNEESKNTLTHTLVGCGLCETGYVWNGGEKRAGGTRNIKSDNAPADKDISLCVSLTFPICWPRRRSSPALVVALNWIIWQVLSGQMVSHK